MEIGNPPKTVDITKVSTERLLAYKKKHYSHAKCFQRDWDCDFGCHDCERVAPSTYKWCKQYEKERDAIREELSKREHVKR